MTAIPLRSLHPLAQLPVRREPPDPGRTATEGISMMPVAVRDVIVTVLGAGGLGIGLAVAQSSKHFGHALVVAFVLVAPALAIARLLPSVNRALALIVGAAGAAVINALVAQSMLSANAWSRVATAFC